MARIPYTRVQAIIDNKPALATTPYTLHGTPKSIYSYGKEIAWQSSTGQWHVVDRQSTRTTNRHIQAVRAVLELRGLCPVIVDYDTGQPIS